MSIEEKMRNAKESHLFDELSEDEKFEAILEGKLQAELEKIKAEIKELRTISYGTMYRTEPLVSQTCALNILDKHISELKGENNA